MNYYIDCEFLEGTQKEKLPISLFRKNTPPTIDLISIGIVSEDGREFYAISKDFNLEEAWNRFDIKKEWISLDENNQTTRDTKIYWIRENVLKPIWRELFFKADMEYAMLSNKQTENFYQSVMLGVYDKIFTLKSLKSLIQKYGKTNKEIAEEIKEFCKPSRKFEIEKPITINYSEIQNPKFHAYYADYDWVAFCWIFGKMIDLPKGFPMYCYDLKQLMDEKEIARQDGTDMVELRNLSTYPKQENEHNALEDARWNKKLHEFLNTINIESKPEISQSKINEILVVDFENVSKEENPQ